MQTHLVKTTLNINTQFFTFPAILTTPTWAKGYKCEPGKCGLCCLTAKPPKNVPQQPIAQLDRTICAHYDIKQKLCKKHTERPSVCKAYPFIFGVEDGKILISTSLECPTTNRKTSIEPKILQEIFENPVYSRQLTLMNDCYEHTILSPSLWRDANHIQHTLTKQFQDFFSRKTEFPFLSEFQDTITNIITKSFRTKIKIPPTPPIAKLVSRQAGIYIATRFESYNICWLKVNGSKTTMTLFDENLKPKKTVKMKTPTKSLNLEIERSAHKLLNDYVSLICNRPFLSLAAIISTTIKPRPAPMYLLRTLASSFLPIEVGATLIATRDKLKAIDRDTMREIISFCEESMIGTFRRPDTATHGVR